jgi:hypothetical protein
MNVVWMSGSTREGPALGDGSGLAWLAGLTRGKRTTSHCVVGGVSEPTTRVPSGVTDVGFMTLVVNRSAVPVPSAVCQYKFDTPMRSDENRRRRPSGVQTGSASAPGSEVNRVKVSRARSQIQMSFS